MKRFLLIFILAAAAAVLGTQKAHSQDLKAYQIFNKYGDVVTFGQLLSGSLENEIVLFGELHNNPIGHWLQLELTMALHREVEQELVLGMEMFEADNQLVIDEYFAGLIAERNFRAEARLWNNYNTDIRPLVEFARENNLKLVASNIPRRYAALVNRQGFEGLNELTPDAQKFVAPLPIPYDPELPGYKAMLEMTGMPAHTSQNFPKAQAVKDATMAHFIIENISPGNIFIHFHGAYHSNNYEGIVWYLNQTKPDVKIVTISTVEQEQVNMLNDEYLGIADFVIVVPQTMTKTF